MFIHSSKSDDSPYGMYKWSAVIKDHYPCEVANWVKSAKLHKWLEHNVPMDEYGYTWVESKVGYSVLKISFGVKADLDIFLKRFVFKK